MGATGRVVLSTIAGAGPYRLVQDTMQRMREALSRLQSAGGSHGRNVQGFSVLQRRFAQSEQMTDPAPKLDTTALLCGVLSVAMGAFFLANAMGLLLVRGGGLRRRQISLGFALAWCSVRAG